MRDRFRRRCRCRNNFCKDGRVEQPEGNSPLATMKAQVNDRVAELPLAINGLWVARRILNREVGKELIYKPKNLRDRLIVELQAEKLHKLLFPQNLMKEIGIESVGIYRLKTALIKVKGRPA